MQKARDLSCSQMSVGTHPDNSSAQAVYLACGFERRDSTHPKFHIALWTQMLHRRTSQHGLSADLGCGAASCGQARIAPIRTAQTAIADVVKRCDAASPDRTFAAAA